MDIIKYFEKMSQDLNILSSDIEKMIANKRGDKDSKKQDMKSFQPVTRLRSSKEEIIKSKEDPDKTFIQDKLRDAKLQDVILED